MPNTAISVKHLTKIYKLYDRPIDRLKESLHPLKKQYHKEFFALNDVNFEIKRGETVGIIGKNGAGKSTLLKIITGVLTPTRGSVHVHGRIASLLELGAGFNPEYTGVENIYFQGSLMGYAREEMEAKIDDILAFADIGDFVYQPVKMYSSGMFARLAFAVAINVDPDILIVDEALSVGDAAFQRKCFARMETIRNNGTTIVFVSHSEGQIVELCRRAIFVHGGQIVLDGEPKRVTGLYAKSMNSDLIDVEAIKEEFRNPPKNTSKKMDKSNLNIPQIDGEENDFEEYFDDSLVSESLVVYESNGARISDVMFTTLEGKNVNVLKQNNEYIYQYKVAFLQDASHIRFGMMIKSLTGVGLTGATFPKETLSNLQYNAGEEVLVQWKFTNYFNDGIYGLNVGIHGSLNQKDIIFLHRLQDAVLFKSQSPVSNFETGLYFNPDLTCQYRVLS